MEDGGDAKSGIEHENGWAEMQFEAHRHVGNVQMAGAFAREDEPWSNSEKDTHSYGGHTKVGIEPHALH
jgi:hypothetical protein